MSDDLFVRHCSPTLAGIKVGNMFSCLYETEDELLEYIQRSNRILMPKGLRVLLLNDTDNRALIYVFRPKALDQILHNSKAVRLLEDLGYQDIGLESCIVQLLARFRQNRDFPHEVGLFLGYPPDDVRCFIENHGGNQKCTGCWKVYGDANAAQKMFDKFKKCTDIYCSLWEKNQCMERLIVAV